MASDREVHTVRRTRNDKAYGYPTGPFRLADEDADRARLRHYVREVSIGPEEGCGSAYAIVTDHGRDRARTDNRYGVTVGPGAKTLGFTDARTSWHETWWAATDTAFDFATRVGTLKRTRAAHQQAEREAAEALFSRPVERAEQPEIVAPVGEAP